MPFFEDQHNVRRPLYCHLGIGDRRCPALRRRFLFMNDIVFTKELDGIVPRSYFVTDDGRILM
jgi:hypothetical protein